MKIIVLLLVVYLAGCSTQRCYPSKKSRDYARCDSGHWHRQIKNYSFTH